MTEDTRKDKRAKIVSLNVRYKSATVDEFIENHSHDVSKGGIFIKTPTPFPPGTLIKFEIRIANDKAVIMGVGRVVWKREPSQSAGERPSGMGVKFIKIDDSSRQLIDRVVAEKDGAGAAYATENEADEAAVKAATRSVSESTRPSERPRIVASASGGSGGSGLLRPGEVRKETIMGIGAPAATAPQTSKPASGGMFPTSTSAPETGPVKEKTVMKQAAELLEEALKEAGGSMDEIGNNPLFTTPKAPAATEADKRPSGANAVAKKGTLVGMPAASSGSMPASKPKSEPPTEAAGPNSDGPKRVSSSPPTSRETPSAKVPAGVASPSALSTRNQKTDPPARLQSHAPASAVAAVAPKKSGGGGLVWVLVLVLVAGAVAFVYKDNLLGTDVAPPPTAIQTPPPPPAVTAAPIPTIAPAPSVVASAAPSSVPSASAAPSAAAPTATAPAATAKPAPTSTPTPNVAAPAPKPTAAPTPTVAAPAPTPKPPPAPKPAPTAATGGSDTASTPTPAPAPKPKPKPAATADTDNPY